MTPIWVKFNITIIGPNISNLKMSIFFNIEPQCEKIWARHQILVLTAYAKKLLHRLFLDHDIIYIFRRSNKPRWAGMYQIFNLHATKLGFLTMWLICAVLCIANIAFLKNTNLVSINGVARTLKKLPTSKGDY